MGIPRHAAGIRLYLPTVKANDPISCGIQMSEYHNNIYLAFLPCKFERDDDSVLMDMNMEQNLTEGTYLPKCSIIVLEDVYGTEVDFCRIHCGSGYTPDIMDDEWEWIEKRYD